MTLPAPPSFKTLVYSPDVRILIEGVDVSTDLVRGQVSRITGGTSALQFTLSNKELRYNDKFRRMDRVVVWMKRVTPILVFSGYLDSVPGLQLYASTVTFKASCTLKRILYTYWDPGLPASITLLGMPQMAFGGAAFGTTPTGSTSPTATPPPAGAPAAPGDNTTAPPVRSTDMSGPIPGGLVPSGGTSGDSGTAGATPPSTGAAGANAVPGAVPVPDAQGDTGLGNMLKVLLTKVGGWDEANVKVQAFPTSFLGYIKGEMPAMENLYPNALAEFKKLFEFDSGSSGSGGAAGGAGGGALGDAKFTTIGPPANGSAYNDMEIVWIVTNAGWTGHDIVVGSSIVKAESGGNPGAINTANSDGSIDRGLWQINSCHDNMLAGQNRMDPAVSTQLARMIYNGRGNWDDWSTLVYHGTAQQHFAEFEPIAASGGTAPPNSGATTGGAAPAPGAPPPATAAPAAPGTAAPSARPPTLDKAIAEAKKVGDGRAYVYGGSGPDGFDCSGYMSYIYSFLTGDGNPSARKFTTESDFAALGFQPGLGAGFSIGVHHGGGGPNSHMAGTLDGVNVESGGGPDATNYGGPASGADHPQFEDKWHLGIMNGAFVPGGKGDGAGGPGGGAAGGGQSNKLAQNIFTFLFDPGGYAQRMSGIYRGRYASVNDEPLITVVQTICEGRMCDFQSLPDGRFSAFYPDYFGLDGTAPVMKLEDVEMKDVKIYINDDALTTHVFTQGATDVMGGMSFQGDLGYTYSPGVVTVEDEWLFKRATQGSFFKPDVANAQEMLSRYGIRPYKKTYPNIFQYGSPQSMLVVAIKLFMQKWAEQYQTTIDLTFMPELYPGMRVELVGHDLIVYVKSVSHNFDFQQGFTTSAQVMAPMSVSRSAKTSSNPDGSVGPVNQDNPKPSGAG